MRRKPVTPVKVIKNMGHRLFLQSRERYAVIKKHKCCQKCGQKHSLEVHHVRPPNWDRVIRVIREELLSGPFMLLCKDCHEKVTPGIEQWRSKE